jgi:hypothetical protein
MKVNDRVTVKTDGGPRRPGVVLAVEQFNEGTMYLVSLEDYPLPDKGMRAREQILGG